MKRFAPMGHSRWHDVPGGHILETPDARALHRTGLEASNPERLQLLETLVEQAGPRACGRRLNTDPPAPVEK
jgi:hypothetical protein